MLSRFRRVISRSERTQHPQQHRAALSAAQPGGREGGNKMSAVCIHHGGGSRSKIPDRMATRVTATDRFDIVARATRWWRYRLIARSPDRRDWCGHQQRGAPADADDSSASDEPRQPE
jgi:hypothetical protein